MVRPIAATRSTSTPAGKTLAERIKQAREAAGLSQAALATAIGTTSLAISTWERGLYAPTDENLVRVAAVLDKSPAWLRYGVVPTPEGMNTEKFERMASEEAERLRLQR